MPVDPYAPPTAPSGAPHQIKIKGAYLTDGKAHPLSCANGELDTHAGVLRTGYVPKWCLPAAFWIFVLFTLILTVILSIPLGVLGPLLYIGTYSILCALKTRPIEFNLNEELLHIDKKNRLVGFRKSQKGQNRFLGFSLRQENFDSIISHFPRTTETPLRKGFKIHYHLLVIFIWFISFGIAMMIHG
ncbi:MAG: hypothetical protein ACSHYF_09990 [Verrucomicrobiaceae bacterium]